MRIFQPEPLLNYYSKGLPNWDKSYLGPLGARVHATSSNFLADYLALNSCAIRHVAARDQRN